MDPDDELKVNTLEILKEFGRAEKTIWRYIGIADGHA
jgi:hypothetical protein